MSNLNHPNERGRWTRLEARGVAALWRRERQDPYPIVQFYLLAPPAQLEILYDETRALARFQAVAGLHSGAPAA